MINDCKHDRPWSQWMENIWNGFRITCLDCGHVQNLIVSEDQPISPEALRG